MSKKLVEILNNKTLMELAGERAFARGEGYFSAGVVVGVKREKETLTARVRGTHYYRVRLWVEADELAFDCDCPVGRDDIFCKHCVAVGLAWLDQQRPEDSGPRSLSRYETSLKDIQTFLLASAKTELVEMLMDRVQEDEGLERRLAMKAAHAGNRPPDVRGMRALLNKAIRKRGFVDYAEMAEYTRGIEGAVDALLDLLKHGYASEVRELTECALEAMESAMSEVDDSDGYMRGILDRLEEVHHAACKGSKPDSKELAKFLFDWEINGEWEIFFGAAGTYADILGENGLAEYEKLAEARWRKVPPLAPGERDPESFGGRFRITHIMEAIAKERGDVEALVAVKSRDLSSAFHFLGIAEIYREAGKLDEALEWAERGWRAFPNRTDVRLREFLAEEYHRRERHEEALAVVWSEYTEAPDLGAFQRLKNSADRIKKWDAWRSKALAVLRDSLSLRAKGKRPHDWTPDADHSSLVEIFLWEKDIEAAWKEASAGGCHGGLWLRLAENRGKEYPKDAISVYRRQLETTLRFADRRSYEEAVGLLRKIRELMRRTGEDADFTDLVSSLRTRHKPRRNFLKLLDAEGW